jgi:hypothetical protein
MSQAMLLNDVIEWTQKFAKESKEVRPRDPHNIVKNILIRKGWEPEKYKPSMKSKLFEYLDEWYTLSVKKLPKPATSGLRKNPLLIKVLSHKHSRNSGGKTVLSNGWEVFSKPSVNGFETIAYNQRLNKETYPLLSPNVNNAFINHYEVVDDVISGEIS